MQSWRLRKAEGYDANGLARCFEAAYADYAGRLEGLPSMSEGCAEEIANHLVYVAEESDEIVGALVLVPSDGFLLLANVAVHPQAQGSGLGRQLLVLAETTARDLDFRELRLTTHRDMGEAISLYLKNGWQECGRQGVRVKMRKSVVS